MSNRGIPPVREEVRARRLHRWRGLPAASGLAATLATAAFIALPGVAQAAGGVTVSGTVAVPSSASTANVDAVLLHDGSESQVANVSATGSYSFTDVSTGSYQVYFVDPTGSDNVAPEYYGGATSYGSAASVSVTTDPTTLNATTLTSGGEVEGTVTNANTGTTASISACPVNTADAGQAAFWNSQDGSSCASGTIAADGSYTIGGLVPGDAYTLEYTFSSSAPAYTDTVYADGSSVTIDPGSATNVTPASSSTVAATSFTVPAVGTVSGAVTDPDGLPDQGGIFVLTDAAGTEVDRASALSNGAYTLPGVIPGSYRVEFIPNSTTLTDAFSGNSTTLDAASYVTITSGTTTSGVNLTTQNGATISGTVTAAQGGAALGGIKVEAVSATGEVLATAVSNANGAYTVAHVPTGSWHLKFTGGVAYNGVRYQTEYYGAKTVLAGSTSITFASGAKLQSYNQAMMVQSATAPGLPTLSKGWTSGEASNQTIVRFKLTTGTGPAGYIKGFKLHLPTNFDWNKSQIKSKLAIANDTYTESITKGWLVVTFPTGKKTVSVQIKSGGINLGTSNLKKLAKEHKLGKRSFRVWARDTVGTSVTRTYTAKNPH